MVEREMFSLHNPGFTYVNWSVPYTDLTPGDDIDLCVACVSSETLFYGQRLSWRKQIELQAALINNYFSGRTQVKENWRLLPTKLRALLPTETPTPLPLAQIAIAVSDATAKVHCVALHSGDATYYRARVLPDGRVSPRLVRVYLIDCGQEIVVPVDQLFELPIEFRHLPPVAAACSLDERYSAGKTLEKLKNELEGQLVTLHIDAIDENLRLFGHLKPIAR